MAKGQVRSNREKKKPKADKNKTKIAPATLSFAASRFPGKPGNGYGNKKMVMATRKRIEMWALRANVPASTR